MNELLKRMNKRIHKSDKNIQPIVKTRSESQKIVIFDAKATKMTDYRGEKIVKHMISKIALKKDFQTFTID